MGQTAPLSAVPPKFAGEHAGALKQAVTGLPWRLPSDFRQTAIPRAFSIRDARSLLAPAAYSSRSLPRYWL